MCPNDRRHGVFTGQKGAAVATQCPMPSLPIPETRVDWLMVLEVIA
jgi:hypothetical protein